MERALAEDSIIRYTAPLKIRDKEGNYLPEERRIPTEITCKILRGEVKYEESKKLQDILNCVLPPREWEEDGELWMQQVSPEPVNRDDVLRLKLLVDQRLKALDALDKGIDPVRRHVYGQLMDEMIRQEVIMNSDRGILLLKVRDELKMTLEANQALFENGKLYGSHKALEAEVSLQPLALKVSRRTKERDALLTQCNAHKTKLTEVRRAGVDSLLRFDKMCLEELKNLNDVATCLKQQIRDVFAGMA